MRRIVLDTNCLLQSVSHRSRFYRIWEDFVSGRYELCVTTEILEEYDEILSRYLSPVVSRLVIEAILRSPNALRVDAQFRFNLISADPDDNKFVDCAIIANAEFIVTNDRHFKELERVEFPRVEIKSIEEFLGELLS